MDSGHTLYGVPIVFVDDLPDEDEIVLGDMTAYMERVMTIRCKYRCAEVTKKAAWNSPKFLYTAKFFAVTSGSPENDKFFEFTPSGSLEIGTYKEDNFEVGQEYYLDITKVG